MEDSEMNGMNGSKHSLNLICRVSESFIRLYI
jgi:hypothetical protein